MGLVILGVLALYLLLSVGIVKWAVSYARKNKKNTKLWGSGAALVMYLLVFWDHIPTVVAHKYYCETEAGFWEYKTVDEWKAENPGILDSLVNNSSSQKYPNWPHEDWRGREIASINQRFGMLYTNHLTSSKENELFINVWRRKTELMDKQTGEIIARRVDFSTGNGYIGGENIPLKFWLQKWHCTDFPAYSKDFSSLTNKFKGVIK